MKMKWLPYLNLNKYVNFCFHDHLVQFLLNLSCLSVSDNGDKQESVLIKPEIEEKKEKLDNLKKETELVSEQLSRIHVADGKNVNEKESVGDVDKQL